MRPLDVEEKLRQRMAVQQAEKGSQLPLDATKAITFVSVETLQCVGVPCAVFLLASLMSVAVWLYKASRDTASGEVSQEKKSKTPDGSMRAKLVSSGAWLISSCSPIAVSMCLSAYMMLIFIHSTFELMRDSVERQHEGIKRPSTEDLGFASDAARQKQFDQFEMLLRDAPCPHTGSALFWATTLPGLLFLVQLLSVWGAWLYLLFVGDTHYVAGVVGPGLLVLTSFYDSVKLANDDPERTALWSAHAVFITSILILISVMVPWVHDTATKFLYALQTNTAQSFNRNRPELNELRSRVRQLNQQAARGARPAAAPSA